jgi:hypothetical protein
MRPTGAGLVLLLASCRTFNDGDLFARLVFPMVGKYVEQNAPSPSDDREQEHDQPVERLMARSRLVVRVDAGEAACSAQAERTGVKTWRVDSCREHLACSATHGAEYSCVASER